MPPRATKRPQDVTGRKAEELAKAHQTELAEKARTLAMVTAQQAEERLNTVVDLTGTRPVEVDVADQIEVSEAYVTIRTNCDLEQVTIGHRNSYDFELGRTYRVPRNVAEHLEEKGLLWH